MAPPMTARALAASSRRIDLRSDTVTRPTRAMLTAMAHADLGDDYYGEDPTVLRLQEVMAEQLGKEASLLFPSGTMANLAAQLTHTRGGAIIAREDSHTIRSELGGYARITGLALVSVEGNPAPLSVQDYESAMDVAISRRIRPSLLWVDQPSQGYVTPLSELADLHQLAGKREIPMHLDGARIFNAAAFLGVAASAVARHTDTVMVSLSKGLGAPVGSVLAGSQDFVDDARTWRQMLGGGMRQAGVIAAAGIHALTHNVKRLQCDHDLARQIAQELAGIPGLLIDRTDVQTNIFFVSVGASQVEFVEHLRRGLVLVNPPQPDANSIRIVTHLDVHDSDLPQIFSSFRAAANAV